MAAEVKKSRISAAGARSHTRKNESSSSSQLPLALGGLAILGILVSVLLTVVVRPPSPKLLNAPNGLQVTAPRVQMRDGRFLAYKAVGVDRENAKHFIITIHGYGASRHLMLPISKELIEEHGLHIVSFDRAGYGQSDHNPKRSIESDVDDVEDLADGLSFGPKFYVITTSIGGYTGWGLLKYKPERLAGIALSAPVVNYWWPSLPASEVKLAWEKQTIGDQMSLRVAHYFPALTYWYMTQKWFPTSSVSPQSGIKAFCLEDQEILKKSGAVLARTTPEHLEESAQRSPAESTFRDLIIMFSSWSFTPMELTNPFDTPVHIWQGTDDYLVPALLQRCIASALPWIQYHELPNHGHFLNSLPSFPDNVTRALLTDSKEAKEILF